MQEKYVFSVLICEDFLERKERFLILSKAELYTMLSELGF